MQLPHDILNRYDTGGEQERLSRGAGRLEELRTRERCWAGGSRRLPLSSSTWAAPPDATRCRLPLPDTMCTCWIRSPLHVEQAAEASRSAAALGTDRGRAHPAVPGRQRRRGAAARAALPPHPARGAAHGTARGPSRAGPQRRSHRRRDQPVRLHRGRHRRQLSARPGVRHAGRRRREHRRTSQPERTPRMVHHRILPPTRGTSRRGHRGGTAS
jgi:hypothetical protein